MPRNSKNNTKGNSNQFELLDTEDNGTDDNTVGNTSTINVASATSTRGRPLKCTQLYDPESPPRKKSVPAKAKATKTAVETNRGPPKTRRGAGGKGRKTRRIVRGVHS